MTLREEEVLIVLRSASVTRTVAKKGDTKAGLLALSEMILCRGQTAEKLVHAASRRHKIGPCYGTFASTLFSVIASS